MTSRTSLGAMLLLSLSLSSPAWAGKPVIIGQTFPIAEPDAMQEIKQKAAAVDWNAFVKKSPASGYSAFNSLSLPRAEKNETHLFDPTYTLPYEIRDDQGKVLYPAGFKINVYEKLYFPGRYIVVTDSPDDLRWLDEVAKPGDNDKVFLAGANPVLLRQSTGRKTFVLEERSKERFGIERVPCIVQQEGLMLRVTEYAIP